MRVIGETRPTLMFHRFGLRTDIVRDFLYIMILGIISILLIKFYIQLYV